MIRIGIAEDHQLVLEGIMRVVEGECTVVGTALNGRDAVKVAADHSPDVMLMDISLPLLNGLDSARQIKLINPNIRIIFVTIQMNQDYVREAFEAGASGYVLKQSASSELLSAIHDVHDGRFYVSPVIAERFLGGQHASSESNPSKLFRSLTSRQREVLQLVAEGRSAKEIAGQLSISVKTVEFHKKHLMEELSLRTSADLIRYAVEKGLVAQ